MVGNNLSLVAGLVWLGIGGISSAWPNEQSVTPEKTPLAVDATGQEVDLPTPPEPFAELIKAGDVRFEFYDPERATLMYRGETRFDFQYSYDSRSDWRLIEQSGRSALSVQVRYFNVQLKRKHRVLLPMALLRPSLYESSLTRHEFDHVAISSDSRLPAMLESMLRQRNASLVQTLEQEISPRRSGPSRETLSQLSQQMVTEASDRVFKDFVDLITIRYQELDRVSNSGRRELTPDEREQLVESLPTQQQTDLE